MFNVHHVQRHVNQCERDGRYVRDVRNVAKILKNLGNANPYFFVLDHSGHNYHGNFYNNKNSN